MILTSVDLPAPFSPEQGVDFRRAQVEIDDVVGEKIAIALGDADRLQQRLTRQRVHR